VPSDRVIPQRPAPSSDVTWEVIAPTKEADLPPLDLELSGWEIHHRRPSHLNAVLRRNGRRYHLKWFFHGRLWPRPSPAEKEHRNALRVSDLGIPTVVPVGWGRHPRGTFFVMEGSPGHAIYDIEPRPTISILRSIAAELGRYVARLHDARICHRDLYVDHVLIDGDSARLIDLGRARSFLRRRWILKDLGGLLFSSWREGLPQELSRAFLRSYLRASRRSWNRKRLLRSIVRKARAYERRDQARKSRRR